MTPNQQDRPTQSALPGHPPERVAVASVAWPGYLPPPTRYPSSPQNISSYEFSTKYRSLRRPRRTLTKPRQIHDKAAPKHLVFRLQSVWIIVVAVLILVIVI